MGNLSGSLVLALGIAAVGGVGWWFATAEPPAPEAVGRPPFTLPVTTTSVERGTVRPRIMLTGSVRSRSRANVAFDASGVLIEIAADEADRVAEGAVLARLDPRDRELLLVAARAELLLAERQLMSLRAGARTEEQKRLEAVAVAARAEERLAELRVERSQKLVADRVLSQQELDTRLSELEALTARRVATEQALAVSRAGARETDVAVQEARVEIAAADVARAERELDKLDLHAPFAGVVVVRDAALGDHINEGEAVFELVDLARLEIVVEVPDRYAALLGDRPPVIVSLDGRAGEPLDAVLDARIPLADARSRNFRGLVRLEGAEAASFEPGMFARVELFLAPLKDVLVVPADALRRDATGDLVVELEPSEVGLPTARLVPVRVLGADHLGTAIEALDGSLAAGATVVLTGLDLAFPGAALLQVDAGEQSDEEVAIQ